MFSSQHFTRGDTVARALWDEFPRDSNTWNLDRQFLWGSSLMVSPVLDQGATSKEVYFPDARWYEITYWLSDDILEEMPFRKTIATLGRIDFHLDFFSKL